jgi:SAM-dependent methyltransferase
VTDLEDRRREVIRRHGAWVGYNLHLGDGVYTMRPGPPGAAEARIQRVVQLVQDLAGASLDGLRVLDLGCHEGGFSIELGLHGAEVLGLDGRGPHLEKARFAARALGLERVTFRAGDVRVDLGALPAFDVVLCLGVLYHLDGPDVVRVARELPRLATRLAIVETQIGLSGRRRVRFAEHEYRGLSYPEDAREAGAALADGTSFWPTRASLVNLLGDAGFTTVAEVRLPRVAVVDDFRDHVTLVARPGIRAALRSAPAAAHDARRPERPLPLAHPAQGLRYRVVERALRLRGGGLRGLFRA